MRRSLAARPLPITIIALAFCLAGCAGSIRSETLPQLLEKESLGLARITDGLSSQKATVTMALADLKTAHGQDMLILKAWENELKRASIVAASPGDLRNKLIRQAVLTELAQLEMDRNDAYANLEREYARQTSALQGAYDSMLSAVAKLQEQIKVVQAYASATGSSYAAKSVDLGAVRGALLEFAEGKKLLAQAAAAGAAADKGLGYVKFADRSVHIREFVDALSLISSRLQEMKP